jgi:hypothetical protein
MGKFFPGIYQFTVNDGRGDVRVYDVFRDGRVREKIASSGQMEYISKEYALDRLDVVLMQYARLAETYSKVAGYNKVYQAKLEHHKQIKNFIEENMRD